MYTLIFLINSNYSRSHSVGSILVIADVLLLAFQRTMKLINFLLFGFLILERVLLPWRQTQKKNRKKCLRRWKRPPKNLSNFSSANHFVTNKSQAFILLRERENVKLILNCNMFFVFVLELSRGVKKKAMMKKKKEKRQQRNSGQYQKLKSTEKC